MTKPPELAEAEMIVELCKAFGCLPSALLAEDAALLRLLAIVAEGRPQE